MAIAVRKKSPSAQPIAADELRRVFGEKEGSVVPLGGRPRRSGARASDAVLVERDQVFGDPDIHARLFGHTTTVVSAAGPVRISSELMDRLRRDAAAQRAKALSDAFARIGTWLRRIMRPARRRPHPPVAPHPCG